MAERREGGRWERSRGKSRRRGRGMGVGDVFPGPIDHYDEWGEQ